LHKFDIFLKLFIPFNKQCKTHTQGFEPTSACVISSVGFQTYLVTNIYSVMPLNMIAMQSNVFKGNSNEA